MLTHTLPRERSLKSLSAHGFHRVVWYEWGEAHNPRVVVCVHGLTRSGRDFDVLGEALSRTHRVIAPDMPGRGRSDWLANPEDYGFPTYAATASALIAAAGVESVEWIGTSMGGLLGMVLAAQPNTPITRLVVNDVGPVVEAAALQRIGAYVGQDPTFATYDEIERYVRTISAPFGALTDAQWRHLTETVVAQRSDGRWGLVVDPGIAIPFRANPTPPELWGLWDAIRCPTLALRGERSDILSAAVAQAMTQRGPRARLIEFPGIGHAPTLLTLDQVDPVRAFLGA